MMGLFDWLTGQFIDVIEWTDDTSNTMVYRFERHGNEIKYGAKLTVRESQIAVFVNEGLIADILSPALYELETNNIPILTSLQHWDHGFNSPFKAEIYFLNTKRFANLKWGTKNPIMVRDPEFAMVRLRAFGSYEIRIDDPSQFLREVVGTDGRFTTQEISAQLSNLILTKFATLLGEDSTPVLDLAANYEKFGSFMTEHIGQHFTAYGLTLIRILVENISLPQEVEKALDKRSGREITGDLDAHVKYQSGEALGNANGSISDMVGMGAGLAMGQQMTNSMKHGESSSSSQTPPPLPKALLQYFVANNGTQEGPYSLEQIKESIRKKEIEQSTLIWTQGMSSWEEARSVLQTHFTQTPPPLP